MPIVRPLKDIFGRFVRNRLGPTITEYAVLLALVVFGAMAAVSLIGTFVSNSMQAVAEAVPGSAEEAGANGSGSGESEANSGTNQRGPLRRRNRPSGRSNPRKGSSGGKAKKAR